MVGDPLLEDEIPEANRIANLRLMYGAYDRWVERLSHPELVPAFLRHASTTVPYYRARFGDAPCEDLARFPIVDRNLHNARRFDFLTTAPDPDPRLDRLELYTNGTLGCVLPVAVDLPTAFDVTQASYLRFAAVRPEILDAVQPGEPTAFVIFDGPHAQRFSIEMPALSSTVLRGLVLGRGAASDEAMVRYLRAARVAVLHGKPSVLRQLAALDRALDGEPIRPTAVVCSGENLYPDVRVELEAWAGRSLIEAYSATECGMLALECEARTGLHVLTEQLVLEVEDDAGALRPTGTGALIVTNAFNWRHAFIRYRLGDRATVIDAPCACGHDGLTIIDLPGRDRVHYGAAEISASEITRALSGVAGLVQYQVSPDEHRGIIVAWVAARGDGGAHDATAREIAARLHAHAPRLAVESRRVASINVPGGKLRRFL